jgi:signal transduction histidine kinase
VVALAFQPVRRRVVRLADRVAYGQAAAPYDALSDFSRRLADSPDPSELLPAVAEAAATAVAAQRATAALHVPGAPDLVASTSEAASGTGAAALELTVGDEDGELGVLSVEMPPGRGLRPRDAALLRDLADQTVVAFRNARLAAELSRDLEQLARRTEALAESRRRLITAGDAERDRLERAIAREVVPHLAAVPDRLEQLASSGADGVRSAALQPLLAEVAAALEALREITRGVYPAQLVRSGLEPALRSLLARTATPAVSVEALPSREQLGPAAEGAAYFCVAEAARDLVLLEAVRLVGEPGALALRVEGRGDPDALPLANMRDRVEAAGGALQALSTADRVVVDVRLPLGGAAGDQAADAAQAALSVSGASSDLVT